VVVAVQGGGFAAAQAARCDEPPQRRQPVVLHPGQKVTSCRRVQTATFHGLLDRGFRVEAVDLVQVDVIGAQPPQRGVDLLEDRPAGLAREVLPVPRTAGSPSPLPELVY